MEERNDNISRPASASRGGQMLPVLPPLAALLEIAVLFGVIVLVDRLHPGIDISEIRPHPFWLPVLLLAIQYGTVSGVIAAVTAIAIVAAGGFPEQGTSETYFQHLLRIWLEPIGWIAAAVGVGQFRMRQLARKQELILQLDELTSQRAAIADYARNLRSHCSALERQIAGRPQGDALLVLQALTEARELAGGRADTALENGFGKVVALALPGAAATLYSLETGGLRLAAATGPHGSETPRVSINVTEPIYRRVIADGASLSVLVRDDEAVLAGHGLAAVPVSTSGELGTERRIVGMIKVEAIPPNALGDTLLPALAAIASPFAASLSAKADGRPVVAVRSPTPGASPPPPAKFWRHLRWLGGRNPQQPEPDAAASPPAAMSQRATR